MGPGSKGGFLRRWVNSWCGEDELGSNGFVEPPERSEGSDQCGCGVGLAEMVDEVFRSARGCAIHHTAGACDEWDIDTCQLILGSQH